MHKPILIAALLSLSASAMATTPPAPAPQTYASQLGTGIIVDWARTERGIREFDPLAVRDYQQRGFGHVRIRVTGEATHQRLVHLQKIVEACQKYNVVPIVSFQAGSESDAQVVAWWTTTARYFAQRFPQLGFDILYEPSDKLSHAQLNALYEKAGKAIHKISPQRMVLISPQAYTQPDSLKWPDSATAPVMANWHLFPYGPVAVKGKRGWTTGTPAEKAAIRARINNVLHWQQKTGHSSWVGAWSVGEVVKSGPTKQQIAFATFTACELQKAHLPFAVNSDGKFYDGEEGAWRPEMQPLLDAILRPRCTN